MNRKNEEARMILPKGWKYITVLDFEVSRVFQYKLEVLDNADDNTYERFITNKGHRLNNCEWMVHDIKEIVDPTIQRITN